MQVKKEVGFELRLLNNAISRAIERQNALQNPSKRRHPPSPMHGRVIGYLLEHQEQDVYQKDLEDAFEIRRSTASRILKSMESNGIIQRISVPQDARLKKIVLTKKAYDIQKKIKININNIEEKLLENITEEELIIFFDVIERMKKNLE